jgi:hypothetical protein
MPRLALVLVAWMVAVTAPALGVQNPQRATNDGTPQAWPRWQTRLVSNPEFAGDRVPIGSSRRELKKQPHYGAVREF